MKTFLPALIILGASMIISVPYADAQTAASTTTTKSTKPLAKSGDKKSAAKKAAGKAKQADNEAPGTEEDDTEPDITGSTSIDYQCELGNRLTIFENAADEQHVALRWNKRLVRMTRVDTTTGAHRFENRRTGLVWIGIPAKGILLDSKKGRQLANECRNAEQLKQNAEASTGLGILTAPVVPAAVVLPDTAPQNSASPVKP